MNSSPSIKFLPQIDGLRFIAVMGVILSHFTLNSYRESVFLRSAPLASGVQLFFVISGFLITKILLQEKQKMLANKTTFLKAIKAFFLKRVLRIFPIYYFFIALAFIFYNHIFQGFILEILTYTVNWYMIGTNGYIGELTHLWSLSVEEQFYIIWPFLIFLVPMKKMHWLIIISIGIGYLSKIYYIFYTTNYIGSGASTFSCFDAFGWGGLIAYFQVLNKESMSLKAYKWLLWISLTVFVIIFQIFEFSSKPMHYTLVNVCVVFISFCLVTIASNNGFTGLTKAFLEDKVVLYLGKISYGIYIFHNFAPTIFRDYFYVHPFFQFPKTPIDYVIVFCLLTFAMASVSWFLIERPILQLKKFVN